MPATVARDGWSLGVAIPAAGLGARMGGVRKPFLELRGEAVLFHALRPFLEHPAVETIAIALSEDRFLDPPRFLRDLEDRTVLVRGGATRGASVWSAIQALPSSVDLVAIHDSARPLVTREIIDRCIEAVGDGRGAVAGWPAVDTLKKVGKGDVVASTLRREEIWHAQTPQVFPRYMIEKAYRSAAEKGICDTDDAALVERIGGEVVMVHGSPENLKVTRSGDLPVAELYLAREG